MIATSSLHRKVELKVKHDNKLYSQLRTEFFTKKFIKSFPKTKIPLISILKVVFDIFFSL